MEANAMDKACVLKGIKFLDNVKPNWRTLIDVNALDMIDSQECIAGQVFREESIPLWMDGYGYLILHVMSMDDHDCDYGFYLKSEGSSWEGLTAAWIELAGL